MQTAITLTHAGMTLRGMEHIPDIPSQERFPAVILFHGFTGTKLEPHRMFLKLSRALEAVGIASVRFDFLGSGESDGHFEEMTLSKEIAEAHSILDYVKGHRRFDPARTSLIGLSMGGAVASILAGDRPDEIEKLVLLAPAGNMYEIVQHVAGEYLADPEVKVADYGGNLVGRAFAEELKQIDIFERSKPFSGEVLLIHGTSDTTVPAEVSLRYKERVYGPRAEVHFIEGADHTFNSAVWESEMIQSAVSFLQGRTGSSGGDAPV
jgi:hypothetical protein